LQIGKSPPTIRSSSLTRACHTANRQCAAISESLSALLALLGDADSMIFATLSGATWLRLACHCDSLGRSWATRTRRPPNATHDQIRLCWSGYATHSTVLGRNCNEDGWPLQIVAANQSHYFFLKFALKTTAQPMNSTVSNRSSVVWERLSLSSLRRMHPGTAPSRHVKR